jgi:3-methyladenine DNA glycosylase AlkD
MKDEERTATPGSWDVQVRQALMAVADPDRAPAMQAYMRGQFGFFGIPTPIRHKTLAPWLAPRQSADALIANARALWRMPERECQYAAIDLLSRQHRRLGVGEIEALLGLAQEKSWWDTVDGLAGIVGDILFVARQTEPTVTQCMDGALGHACLWVRRIAMLHQLGWRQHTDRQRLFGYALALAGEQDFFIRKAIGWALRDFARTDPQAVADFLNGPGRQLSSLSRREAGKHLDGVQ